MLRLNNILECLSSPSESGNEEEVDMQNESLRRVLDRVRKYEYFSRPCVITHSTEFMAHTSSSSMTPIVLQSPNCEDEIDRQIENLRCLEDRIKKLINSHSHNIVIVQWSPRRRSRLRP